MSNIQFIGVVAGIAIVLLIVVGLTLTRLYQKASPEQAFVRTGVGGPKVIVNGGAIVLPVLHQITWVNMSTLRLEVSRAQQQSLITQDRMRVDVSAEFYVKVSPEVEAIITAARTLGDRTQNPKLLAELVEGKFVDSLRSVAAMMTMTQLHEKRVDFVNAVQKAVSEDLLKNGLILEAVSLTSFNQTDKDFFNAENAFDAEGLTRLTQVIQEKAKTRNAIEQDTRVEIERRNVAAHQETLQLNRQRQELTLANERDIAVATANQEAEVAEVQAKAKQQADQAKMTAARTVREAELQNEQAITLAQQDQAIKIADKSREEAAARAAAQLAKVEAVRAEEQVATARAMEIAERQKKIACVEAAQSAEVAAVALTRAATAEAEAAEARARALVKEAEGQRDAATLQAEAILSKGKAEAEAAEARTQAENMVSTAVLENRLRTALIEVLPAVVAASVKPLENIDSIRIAEVGGLGMGSGTGANANGPAASGSLTDNIVTSALKYQAHAPMLAKLLQEVGLGNDLSPAAITSTLADQIKGTAPAPQPEVTVPAAPETPAE